MDIPAINTRQRRLSILGEDEIEVLYGRPRFAPEERIEYFSLSPREKAALDQLHSIKSRVGFILQLGYFKARVLFFTFDLGEVEEDAQYVRKHYFPDATLTDLKLTKVTRLKQQRLILDLCHYHSCGPQERQQLETKAQQVAMVFSKPIYIFRALMQYLDEQRTVSPSYSSMQDTVGRALTGEQNRLMGLLRDHLRADDIEALKRLLEDAPGLYEITQLKREPKDFSAGEIKREIQRGEQIRSLYHRVQAVLPALGISNESIKYYASLVSYYSVYKLKRLPEWMVYLYLLCFVYHRYQRLHDHLINGLIQRVRRYGDEAKTAAKERVYAFRIETNQNLQKAGQVLKLFTDDRIEQNTPFQVLQATAFDILDRQKLAFVADHIVSDARFDETAFQWDYIDDRAHPIKLYLRPILQAVEWAATGGHAPLMKAVDFLKTALGKGKPLSHYPLEAFPVEFIPEAMKRYLYGPNTPGPKLLRPDRYEFLVYRLVRQGVEAGDLFCRDSVRFRSLEEDLLDDQTWQAKEKLILDTGLTILNQPIRDHLNTLEQALETRLAEVNRRIATGENEYFQIKHRGPQVRWTLQSPHRPEAVNHPFFDTLQSIDIRSVLHFVHQQCRFMDAFEHVLGRYAKQEADERLITAGLIAWATNMGLRRMGAISDIGYPLLAGASDNFIRLETLREANDAISNALAELAIVRHYQISDHVHSSSDGQKFETQFDTINARYSPKYFGLKKGIVSYSLIANHVPVNAKIIGANEHESHYVFDLLFNNTTDLQPQVHSTDTHGTNQVNFALLHLFGYQFAPRYKDLQEKVSQSLYGFQHPSRYDGIIQPIRKINTARIIEEWENIQRSVVSLAVKTTTQSILVGKLSAHVRKNKTRRALWEYDNIIRSLYLLEYIDSPTLRQDVQLALNRGENYHKLRRAVSYANFGKLRFKTEYEQQLWGECSRLITNSIIYYNASLLSQVLAYKEKGEDSEGRAWLKQISPVAWQHVNFYGRYEFNKRPEPIDMDTIVSQLAQVPVQPTGGG